MMRSSLRGWRLASARAMGVDEVLRTLSTEHRQVLVGLQLLSHGATASLSPVAGRGGGSDQVLPSGELCPPHERYLAALRKPGADVEAIMNDARDELDAWKRRPHVAPVVIESLTELKARIVECAGWPASDVAIAMRCTDSLVKVARVEAGCEPEHGEQLDEPLPTEPRERARVLVDLGLSYRQVEALCGVPITTIFRARKRAA